MKKFALLAALPLAAGFAVAQSKPVPQKAPTKIKCAVMPKMDVDIAKATKEKMFHDYKGRRYYFCCAGCPRPFKKNPEKYKKNASLPVPKSTPKKK